MAFVSKEVEVELDDDDIESIIKDDLDATDMAEIIRKCYDPSEIVVIVRAVMPRMDTTNALEVIRALVAED